APVVEAAGLGEVMGLVGETRAQAAGIGLVEADDVVTASQLRDRAQAAALVAGGEHVRPAARDVIAVAARAGACLDVRAQQAQPARTTGGAGVHVVRRGHGRHVHSSTPAI